MTLLVKELNSKSLPCDSNKLQLHMNSQKAENLSSFPVIHPAHGQKQGREGRKRNSINR